jgi:heme/copper-type cytochrome/quinol oxidase subunit 2
MLAGRRLHDAMLADALGRGGRRQAVAVVVSMLAVLLIVLFAIVFCVWILLRRQADGLRPGF